MDAVSVSWTWQQTVHGSSSGMLPQHPLAQVQLHGSLKATASCLLLLTTAPDAPRMQAMLAHEHYSLLYRVQTINPGGTFYTLRILLSAADVGLQVGRMDLLLMVLTDK
jgi:hypothetical protein